MPPVVPPVKCQGIKTKLAPAIKALSPTDVKGRWIEPLCGSCVVPLNLRPKRALLCDSNEHIIRLYSDLQTGSLTPGLVKEYLVAQGSRLRRQGEEVYYEIRDSFNHSPNSLAFLFLNRSCFNGVMRFNRKGGFNVPFCRKPERYSRSLVSKIVNQLVSCAATLRATQWIFHAADFRETLAKAGGDDFVYADPPYAGRHVDYYNTWAEQDERDLASLLGGSPCPFLLSTWHSNKFRSNPNVSVYWSDPQYTINTWEHFYHVGSKESLRHAMTEAFITNYPTRIEQSERRELPRRGLFDEIDLPDQGT